MVARSRRRVPIETRFWAKVDVSGGPSGCWPWLASTDRKGYGHIGSGETCPRMRAAHRVSWELHHGAIPQGAWVLHRCDNPLCVNPRHLFLGDSDANIRDMRMKGRNRAARGEATGAHKLTDAIVRDCRRRAGEGESHSQLAREFGVSVQNMNQAIRGLAWRHVP